MVNNIAKRYDVKQEIARGGMDTVVYFAIDTYSNEKVAIKVLSRVVAPTDSYYKRFKSEIAMMSEIRSEYVARLVDSVNNDEINYIVMEYVGGITLKNRIHEHVMLSNDEAVSIAKDIARGLEDIHAANIVHRDIKSSNIILTDSGRAKIIDLGIAVNDETTRVTKTNNIIGTVHYIAPEILDGKKPTPSWDIYALGILMFEMLAGRMPFDDKDYKVVSQKHRNAPLPIITKYNPNVRQSIINIIKKATAKNPEDRYKTASEMRKDLDTALSDKRLNEAPTRLKSEKHSIGISNIVKNHWFIVIGLGIALIIVILLIVLLMVKGV